MQTQQTHRVKAGRSASRRGVTAAQLEAFCRHVRELGAPNDIEPTVTVTVRDGKIKTVEAAWKDAPGDPTDPP